MSQEDRSIRIQAEAEQLISEVERQLEDGESFFREHGIDRQKLLAMTGGKEKEEASRLLAEDLAAVERELAEARARESFARPASVARPSHRRTMI